MNEKNRRILHFFDGEITIEDKNEIAEIKWVDINTANNLMPYHRDGVERLLISSSPYTFQGECL